MNPETQKFKKINRKGKGKQKLKEKRRDEKEIFSGKFRLVKETLSHEELEILVLKKIKNGTNQTQLLRIARALGMNSSYIGTDSPYHPIYTLVTKVKT